MEPSLGIQCSQKLLFIAVNFTVEYLFILLPARQLVWTLTLSKGRPVDQITLPYLVLQFYICGSELQVAFSAKLWKCFKWHASNWKWGVKNVLLTFWSHNHLNSGPQKVLFWYDHKKQIILFFIFPFFWHPNLKEIWKYDLYLQGCKRGHLIVHWGLKEMLLLMSDIWWQLS